MISAKMACQRVIEVAGAGGLPFWPKGGILDAVFLAWMLLGFRARVEQSEMGGHKVFHRKELR
jgi:hypothetical protein